MNRIVTRSSVGWNLRGISVGLTAGTARIEHDKETRVQPGEKNNDRATLTFCRREKTSGPEASRVGINAVLESGRRAQQVSSPPVEAATTTGKNGSVEALQSTLAPSFGANARAVITAYTECLAVVNSLLHELPK